MKALIAGVLASLAFAVPAEGYIPGCNSRKCEKRVKHKTLEKKYQRAWSRAPASIRNHLRQISKCESGGDHTAVSPNGKYRGLLQFDYSTWQSVGGKPGEDPAAATRWRQWVYGVRLYEMRGPQPWPICGFLRG